MTTLSSSRIIKGSEQKQRVRRYSPPVEKEKKIEKKKSPGEVPASPGLEETSAEIPEEEDIREEWNYAQIEEKANAILGEAQREGQRIIEEAREQAGREQEEARKTGYEKGYEEGLRQGEQNARQEFEAKLEECLLSFEEDMRKALESAEEAKEACVRAYLDELKDCAVSIAEKVIHISLKSSGEVIKQMIVSATEKLKKTAWVKIYIDKFDYDMMMKADADVIDELLICPTT